MERRTAVYDFIESRNIDRLTVHMLRNILPIDVMDACNNFTKILNAQLEYESMQTEELRRLFMHRKYNE